MGAPRSRQDGVEHRHPLESRKVMATQPLGRAHSVRYIPELDGIRAISILMVLTAHLHTQMWKGLQGGHGVLLFFLLSGYLITSILLKEDRAHGRISIGAFYLRRTFRIFPLYYLVLGIYCLLIFGLNFSPEKRLPLAKALPYYLTYLQEIPFRRPETPFYQSWSLGVEEKFYLVWPVLAFTLLARCPRWRIPVTFSLILITGLTAKVLSPYVHILMGCLLAFLLDVPRIRSSIARSGALGAWIGLSALGLAQGFGMEGLAYAFVAACFLALLLTTSSLLNRLVSNAVLVWLGKISYGFYLVHILCLNVAEHLARNAPIPALAIAVVLSAGVAFLLHVVVESPLISMGRRLARSYAAPTAHRWQTILSSGSVGK